MISAEDQITVAHSATPALMRADQLSKTFPVSRNLFGRVRRSVHAVRNVTMEIPHGLTVGIVGESGSGKTTLGRMLARLEKVDSGTLTFDGREVTDLDGPALRRARRDIQMIFQDPYGSLDPTKTAAHAVYEPMIVHKTARGAALMAGARELADRVALDPRLLDRYPDQLSGGQRQRISIARALALRPKLLIADEPTSALDLSTRSEILNLLMSLQENEKLSIALISHDFTTVRHISHQIAVMYLGQIVEHGPAEEVAQNPLHPYTKSLLSAVPIANPRLQRRRRRIVLDGEQPNPTAIPSGCPFRTRCPEATPDCAVLEPPVVDVGPAHRVACLLYADHQQHKASPEQHHHEP